MTTKPLDFNKPITTRDGRAVRILCTDRKATSNWPVVGLVMESNGREIVRFWSIGGKVNPDSIHPSGSDLINPPPPKVKLQRYVNVYRRGPGVYTEGAGTFKSLALAIAAGSLDSDYYTTVPITIEFQPEE